MKFSPYSDFDAVFDRYTFCQLYGYEIFKLTSFLYAFLHIFKHVIY